jgi:hypothetical protein
MFAPFRLKSCLSYYFIIFTFRNIYILLVWSTSPYRLNPDLSCCIRDERSLPSQPSLAQPDSQPVQYRNIWSLSIFVQPAQANLVCSVLTQASMARRCLAYHSSQPAETTITRPSLAKKPKLNSLALVRKRTILTERPPLVGEVSANFCG